MTRKNPHISPAITDVPLRQTLQSIVDNSSANVVITGNGPPSNSSASEGTVYHDAATNNLFIFSKGAYSPVQPKINGSVTHDVGTTDVSELTSSEVAYYWDKALQENTGGYQNPSDGEVFILTSNHATGSKVYVYNGSGTVLTLNDEDSTQVDVNSWYQQASYIPGNLIVSQTLTAEKVSTGFIDAFSINANLIDAGTMNAARLQLTGNAEFSQGGGISFNKPNATSENNGLFFGSTSSQGGADDFTFYASNAGTGSNDDKRSIKVTKDELTLVNPTLKVGNAGTEVELYANGDSDRIYTSTGTINKTDNFAGGSGDWNGYEIIKIVLVGGGGGGGSRGAPGAQWNGNPGSTGGTTQITLNKTDGSTSTFSATGGAGGAGGTQNVQDGSGTAGEDGPINPQGSTSSGGSGGPVTKQAGGNASGRGAGGGGAGGRNPGSGWFGVSSIEGGKGGKAGSMTVAEIDASLLTSITINSIGAGGAGNNSPSPGGGDGTGGLVKLYGAAIDLSTVNLGNLSNPSFNAIGTYAFGRSSTTKAAGQTLAGSNITASNSDEVTGGTTFTSGTWRCMGRSTSSANATLWVRIS